MNNEQKIIEYIQSLLFDIRITEDLPEELDQIKGMREIDHTLRRFRTSIKSIGTGDFSENIEGKGYIIGVTKTLQSVLKNLVWQTKAISHGDFSQRVNFLGEFSDSFNEMTNKLETTIFDLRESKELFQMLFDTIPDATMIVSLEKRTILDCNHVFEGLLGRPKADFRGKKLSEISFFKDRQQEYAFFQSFYLSGGGNCVFIELKLHGENEVFGLCSSAIVTIKNEKYILSVIKDVTKMKKLEQSLKKSEKIHRLLADNASDVIWTMGLDGKFTYISPSVEKLRGFKVEEVFAQTKEELLVPSSRSYLDHVLKMATEMVEKNLPFDAFRSDIEFPCKDGSTVWTDSTVSGIYDNENHFMGLLGVSRDITERKQMEEQIRKLSEIDRLTQLYNRSKIDAVLNAEVEHLSNNVGVCSVILLDIDYFKRVNDTWGHLVGDAVLKEIAGILRTETRERDTVGRWGGEEFLIILPSTGLEEAIAFAEKIRIKISEFHFSEINHLTASFGVAETTGRLTPVEILAKVDGALYHAKRSGRNCVCSMEQ